ncbi:hypothetical protein [Geobacter argillaceus]|uniref:Uncharacterized protein n=1 Tax=Geobacter argillaceus TaxID=345631 RepID=A0A562VMG6_9BACT|nr:hypothetical protein [Geobacter argillaceus]TWJ18927.1 hypothetical protein JN12_02142 [Geobacter argillaceus]
MTARKSTKPTTATKPLRKKPSWSDVKSAIADFERSVLIGLISDLYAYSTPNKNFLHARFSLGSDSLKPYKKIIEDALFPDVMSNDDVEIATAKKAISDYGKAVGDPKGMLELMVHFVECGASFSLDVGYDDEHFFASLERMYEKAVKLLLTLDEAIIDDYYDRFEDLVISTQDIGWGFHDTLGDIFYEAFPEE